VPKNKNEGSPEYLSADDHLAEIEAIMLQDLSDGNLPVNFSSGEASDSRLGGGPKAFRCDKYLGGLLAEVAKDLHPRVSNQSDLLRTAITSFCLAWIRAREGQSAKLMDLRSSIDAERILMTRLREEHARREVMNQAKALGSLVHEYRLEGDIAYAITLVSNWIDMIGKEPNDRFRRKLLTALRNAPEIRDVAQDAQMRGLPEAAKVRKFLESKEA